MTFRLSKLGFFVNKFAKGDELSGLGDWRMRKVRKVRKVRG